MSYSLQPIGAIQSRTDASRRLVPEGRNWFERNQKTLIIGGAVVGLGALTGLIIYARVKTEQRIREESGELGVQAYRTMNVLTSIPFWMR